MDSYDWLFGESQSPRVRFRELLETCPETSEDSPKAGQSFEVSPTDPVWTTAKGDKIPLSKMETRHICNCINLLESKKMYRHKWYRIFKDELERRRTGQLETSYSLQSNKKPY